MADEIQGVADGVPRPIPPRPDLYALAAMMNGRWTLAYAGMDKDWIVKSQQPLHPGSVLVKFPGETLQQEVRDGGR